MVFRADYASNRMNEFKRRCGWRRWELRSGGDRSGVCRWWTATWSEFWKSSGEVRDIDQRGGSHDGKLTGTEGIPSVRG